MKWRPVLFWSHVNQEFTSRRSSTADVKVKHQVDVLVRRKPSKTVRATQRHALRRYRVRDVAITFLAVTFSDLHCRRQAGCQCRRSIRDIGRSSRVIEIHSRRVAVRIVVSGYCESEIVVMAISSGTDGRLRLASTSVRPRMDDIWGNGLRTSDVTRRWSRYLYVIVGSAVTVRCITDGTAEARFIDLIIQMINQYEINN